MPLTMIAYAEREGLDWTQTGLYVTEIEQASPRDTLQDVEAVIHEINRHSARFHLGENGERIQQVLDGIDPGDMDACAEAWFDYLDENLKFPFEVKLVETDSDGPIRLGDTVRVISFNDVFDDYGILVDVKKGRRKYQLPLADVEVTEKSAPQYQPVRDYGEWFANR